MTPVLIAAMPGECAPAARLGAALKMPVQEIAVHHFPDHESRVRAESAATTTLVYCSLDRPNEKLVELAFAASALRDLGARRLVLIAPYLCYMRQDTAFENGEAVSQRVIGHMLSTWFDRVVTIEPHLHRVCTLDDAFPGVETTALSAAPLLAELIRKAGDGMRPALIVGPDLESQTWAEAVASNVGVPCSVLKKVRVGDKSVSVFLNDDPNFDGRKIFLIDDVASTGNTLASAARLVKSRGAEEIEAIVAHALFDDAASEDMSNAGISRVRSTDSVRHPTNAIEVAPLLSMALSQELSR